MDTPDPERFSAAPSDAVEAILRRALTHAEAAEWESSATLLREGLEEHPEDPYLLCWLGLTEREMGMEGIAYERFRRALAQEPQDPVLLATAGTALAAVDDEAAEAALRTAAMIAPNLAQARWRYGAYLAREGMIEEALRELDAAVQLDPDDPIVHFERGVAKAVAGDTGAAASSFAQAAELNPDDGWALVLLGLARLQEDGPDEAAPHLEEGARLRPDDVEAQLLAALALSAGGWEDRALEMLERARMQAEGAGMSAVMEVEERIEDGPEAAIRFLRESLAPSSFRERLMERP